MIRTQVKYTEAGDTKDLIDEIDDPYDLYDEESVDETADFKEIIKEEKARQKQHLIKNTVKNSSALVSLYRILPYAFLVLGFMALENNHAMQLIPYMLGLGCGVVVGYFVAKKIYLK